MTLAFRLPDLGEGIHEGEVVAVLVSEGEQVQEGQPILQVETDKASVEIPSPFTGIVREIKVKPEDNVDVGTVLMTFEANEAAPASANPKTEAGAPSGAVAPSVVEPVLPKRGDGPVPASPATRRLARELGVDLREVPATGRAGLVTAEDVRSYAQKRSEPAEETKSSPNGRTEGAEAPALTPTETAPTPGPAPAPAAPPLPDFARWGPVQRVHFHSVRRATAKHLALAWSQIPHALHQDEADITALDAFRRQHASEIEARGGKLTLTVFVLKAAAAALKAFPNFNSSLDLEAEEIVLKQYYHLGVAVDTDRGLLVPVIRDVECKSITELTIELSALAQRTRAGQVSLEEMQGGTFTITNLGAQGGTGFAPIVNFPQVAILGMGRARLRPVVQGGLEDYRIVPRLMLPLALAFDHRVLDGADAARFSRMIINCLENPDQLWLRI